MLDGLMYNMAVESISTGYIFHHSPAVQINKTEEPQYVSEKATEMTSRRRDDHINTNPRQRWSR